LQGRACAQPWTVEAFGDFIKRDTTRWMELVESSGATAE
jgi:hypothetical protein